MRSFVARRVSAALAVVFLAYVVTFVLFNVLPADAVLIKFAVEQGSLTEQDLDSLRDHYGIGGSLLEQFWAGLRNVVSGDFGYSITHGERVTTILADALPSTIKLTLWSLAGAVVIATLVAVGASYANSSILRKILQTAPSLFASVPTFLIGILFIQAFSFGLHLVPAIDDGSWLALVGPVLTLSIFTSAPLAQVFHRSLEHAKNEPYARVAEAKGGSRSFVFRRHVLRNAIIPVLTVFGLTIGELIAGSVITETVFARQGVGRTTLEAVVTQDFAVVQAVVLMAALTYVIVNLLVDLLYFKIDPRVRNRAEGQGANA